MIAKKIKVTINDSDIFEAWSLGEDWNGWAMPYFEKNVADIVAKIHNGSYIESSDTYLFNNEDETEEYSGMKFQTPEGNKKVYPIGTGFWIWDFVEY